MIPLLTMSFYTFFFRFFMCHFLHVRVVKRIYETIFSNLLFTLIVQWTLNFRLEMLFFYFPFILRERKIEGIQLNLNFHLLIRIITFSRSSSSIDRFLNTMISNDCLNFIDGKIRENPFSGRLVDRFKFGCCDYIQLDILIFSYYLLI